jgi:hypothetical protein
MPLIKDAMGNPKHIDAAKPPVEIADLNPTPETNVNISIASDGTPVITMPDGSVEIGTASTGGIAAAIDDDNLANNPTLDIGKLANDLLTGIEDDIRSRAPLIAAYTKGLDLLGIRLEEKSGRRRRKKSSTVRHPVMLEAIVDFQSSAMAELLPPTGPVKAWIGGGVTTEQEENLAQQLEDDLNFYLTDTATEYYPDTDRGLFYLGYGGNIFKKIYQCPLRKRPVSETVYMTDLIVSENATDLDNAIRVTHKIDMNQSDILRMQLRGVWRDVPLVTPSPVTDPVELKEKMLQGTTLGSVRPQELPHTIYECSVDLMLSDYGMDDSKADKDIPCPYRVTIDKDSRAVLDVRRMWKNGDKLYKKQLPFVHFSLIPAMGFLALGFLHLLGNQTMTLTAIWRILVDAGMFSNFPGGVISKGTRQQTNEIEPGPGEFAVVDTGPGMSIKDAIMPLPYKEPSQVLIGLSEIIQREAQSLISIAKLDINESAANVPVGTIMAMIQQQTKNMSAVHKRLHYAQKRELVKLRDLFAENPEALYRHNPKARQWKAEELLDVNIIPSSDPNLPSQTHRSILATAKVQLAQQNPDIYDKYQAHMEAWHTMGVDASSFLHQPPPAGPDNGQAIAAAQLQMQAQLKQAELKQKEMQQQREAADRVAQVQLKMQELNVDTQNDAADRASKEKVAMIEQETQRLRMLKELHSENQDRVHKNINNHLDRNTP